METLDLSKKILEASKKVQAKKTEENYLVVWLGYSAKLVLPHKEGILFLQSLTNAEQLHDDYGEKHHISGISRNVLKTEIMSSDEYKRIKIAALLNIKPEEVLEAQKSVALTTT